MGLAARLLKELANCVDNESVTWYSVAKKCGLAPPVLYRFADGSRKDIKLSTADKIIAFLYPDPERFALYLSQSEADRLGRVIDGMIAKRWNKADVPEDEIVQLKLRNRLVESVLAEVDKEITKTIKRVRKYPPKS